MMQTSDASNIVCGHCGGLVKGSCCWMAGNAYHNSCYSLVMGVERGLASVIDKDARIAALEAERDVLLADRAMYVTTLKTSESLLGCEHFGEIPEAISGLQAERDQLARQLYQSCSDERADFEGRPCPVGVEVDNLTRERDQLRAELAAKSKRVTDLGLAVVSLRAELADATAWRPISTAPTEGRVLLWRAHGTVPIVAKFDAIYGEFEDAFGDHVYGGTHWMPLPAAPVEG